MGQDETWQPKSKYLLPTFSELYRDAIYLGISETYNYLILMGLQKIYLKDRVSKS